jgi:DNA adenine methylase
MSRFNTPLRYPGGKQKLFPFILEIIEKNDLIGGDYVEPYAGGAGVAIELLLGGHVKHIHLNDSAYPVFAFWKSVITNPERLCQFISRASLTIDEWKKRREIVRHPEDHDELEVGFSTFFLNRCNRSGVLSGGIIGGLDQSGKWKMDARFSRNELIRRIEAIAVKKSSITVNNLDAEDFIINYIPSLPSNTLVYCDPPYFDKSSQLYLNRYRPEDHIRISKVIQQKLLKKWVVSYDYQEEILKNYIDRRNFVYSLQYNASTVYKGQELFIFSDDLTIPGESKLPYIHQAIKSANLIVPI